MMLTGRNEWIAIGALILYIAFVPCPYWMKQFFASPAGKAIALGVVIYAWKYVSCPVAILLLVAFLRSGAIREYLEGQTGMTPPSAPTASTAANDYTCPSEYTYVAEKMMCMKGNESKNPEFKDASMTWDSTVGKCVSKPTTSGGPPATSSSGGPPGGISPGTIAAMNEMANSTAGASTTTTESFTPYGGKEKDFAPL
jgi:hypothetical protein